MKIIQFLGELDEHGVGRYIIELNEALKMTGHDVEIVYFENDYDKTKSFAQVIPNVITMNYGQELFDKLNDCDIILINTLIHLEASDQERKDFYDVFNHIDGPLLIAFNNEHGTPRWKVYYNEFTGDEDGLGFLRRIDKFVTFSPWNKVFKKIEKIYPDIIKKYVHMKLPYRFADPSTYIDYDDKYKRVSYMGRFALFKDPARIVRHREDFVNNGYQLEMRGMVRTFTMAMVPYMVYVDFKANPRVKSPYVFDLTTKKALKTNYPDYFETDPDLIHVTDRDINKVYLFGKYKREKGLEAMKYAQFGCDFLWHKNPLALGDDLEYVAAEIVDMGTIPMLDYEFMEKCRVYDKDGNGTDTMAIDCPCGICLKRDGSNIDEVISQMNKLSNDKEEYNKYRLQCLEFFKNMYDPVMIANKLIKDILNPDNTQALKDFGL